MSQEQLGKDIKLVEKEEGIDIAITPYGDLDVVSGDFNLGQSLINKLRTSRGELGNLGHRIYGSRLHELIGEPNNERTKELIRSYVREALLQDPRIREITYLSLETYKDNLNRIDIKATITPITGTSLLNIVFPFYLEVAS
ncbi:GPW/gp25 family protein [Candidatus Bathyarchaeota archaeon]|nr:GPW/gp25 family protein [Candidatus Bathyarchaeota archaeon]